MVSSASVTGTTSSFGNDTKDYFKRISGMNLKNSQIVGFGISDKQSFIEATDYSSGAIIGSAFIKHLTKNGSDTISEFVKTIR
jgi:tryptophan synthase alpha chain